MVPPVIIHICLSFYHCRQPVRVFQFESHFTVRYPEVIKRTALCGIFSDYVPVSSIGFHPCRNAERIIVIKIDDIPEVHVIIQSIKTCHGVFHAGDLPDSRSALGNRESPGRQPDFAPDLFNIKKYPVYPDRICPGIAVIIRCAPELSKKRLPEVFPVVKITVTGVNHDGIKHFGIEFRVSNKDISVGLFPDQHRRIAQL